MNHYKDLDTLYAFLKSITSIEEFFARKEPCFSDDVSRAFTQWLLENGDDERDILSALKSSERQKFAESLKERARPN